METQQTGEPDLNTVFGNMSKEDMDKMNADIESKFETKPQDEKQESEVKEKVGQALGIVGNVLSLVGAIGASVMAIGGIASLTGLSTLWVTVLFALFGMGMVLTSGYLQYGKITLN